MKKQILSLLFAFALIIPTAVHANTVWGTLGNDALCGSIYADIIQALSGNDVVYAGSGDDNIYGGWGLVDKCYGEGGLDQYSGCEYIEIYPDTCPCDHHSKSATIQEGAEFSIIIAPENFEYAAGGLGIDVVLFPIENFAIEKLVGSDIVTIVAGNKEAVDNTMSALSFATVEKLVLSAAIEKQINGTYTFPVEALTATEAADIAAKLFTATKDGITMINPYTGNTITLKHIDYIGFKNTPLIPVIAK